MPVSTISGAALDSGPSAYGHEGVIYSVDWTLTGSNGTNTVQH